MQGSSSMDLRAWNRRKNNWLRVQKGKWGNALLGAAPVTSVYAPAYVHKVLVLRNDNKLGDAVAGSTLFRGLRQLFPQATIDVVACQGTAPVFRSNGFIDRIWCATEGLLSLSLCGLKLRREHYDLYIDVDEVPMLSSLVFLKCLAPRWALGINREKYPLYNMNLPLKVEATHITKRYEELLRCVGFTGAFDTDYYMQLPQCAVQEAKAWAQEKFAGKEFWVFNPTASSRDKSFTVDQILFLCNHFAQKNIVLVGQQNRLRKWLQGRMLPPSVCIYSKDVFYAVALATQAKLLFTPDTFWVHAACALRIPTVCVYNFDGPKNGPYTHGSPAVWRPLVKEVKMMVYPGEQNSVPVEKLIQAIGEY